MKVCVYGEGHLAKATADGCIDAGFDLTGPQTAEVVWFCMDTPVDADDRPNVAAVLACFTDMMTAVKPNRPILISSQLPVGTCDEWQGLFPQHTLSVNPENIRKATAREDFRHQARMIVGTNTQYLYRDMFTNLLSPFTDDILWMSPRSAEMAKHVLNGYLAMCIVFANEIRDICEMMRCDVADVFCGFRSDPRVSMTAPLEPGGPYSGGTIGRDVRILRSHSIKSPSLLATVDDANRKRL